MFETEIKTPADYQINRYYDPKNCEMSASFALPELPLNQEIEVKMLKKGQREVNFMSIFFMKSTNHQTVELNNL